MSNNSPLFHAIIGHTATALASLGEAQDFQTSIIKAQLLISSGKPTDAIQVLDGTKQETPYEKWHVFQMLTKAFLLNSEPKSAQVCLNESAKLWAEASQAMGSDTEREECEAQVKLLETKVTMERQNTTQIGNINDYAFIAQEKPAMAAAPKEQKVIIPTIDGKYDWYQNATHVFVTFKVSGDKELSKNTMVAYTKQSFGLEANNGQNINIQLSSEIDPDNCTTHPTPNKLEIKLKKVVENINWMSLEPGKGQSLLAASAQIPAKDAPKATPFASKKNWDQIEADCGKELDEDKPEGDGAMNALFKQIYDRADPDTRRAMMKSYQTSGGTVLSTNWGEVADKDYEGRDRPSAPDGQMWADDAEKAKAQGQK